jgi:hypothetical protein
MYALCSVVAAVLTTVGVYRVGISAGLVGRPAKPKWSRVVASIPFFAASFAWMVYANVVK